MGSSPALPSSPPPFDPSAPDRPHRRRWLWWAAGATLVLLVLAGLWPAAVPVETAVVRRGPLEVTVDEEGVTQVRHRYVVATPVAGHLQRIPHKAGAPLVAGETVLAVLEPGGADLLDARTRAQAQARVLAAESALAQAEAQRQRAAATLELARAEAERLRNLAEQGMLSQQELQTAQTAELTARQEERAAVFAQQVAQFELEQARATLLRAAPGSGGDDEVMPIVSPISGRVLRVLQESARPVPAGLPLLEIGDPADLEVRIEVLSRHGVVIQPGAPVWLEQWGGPEALEARVRLVEPAAFTKISALGVEEQRVNVLADLVTPPEKRTSLGDNFRVEARIVTWQDPAALQVPAGALFQREGRWWTFALDGGRAQLRAVEVGESNGVATRVRSGLNEGETVIVYPGDRVEDGSRIDPLDVRAR